MRNEVFYHSIGAGSAVVLKEHLIEELDFYLLPQPAWLNLLSWYGFSQGSHPIPRYIGHSSSRIHGSLISYPL